MSDSPTVPTTHDHDLLIRIDAKLQMLVEIIKGANIPTRCSKHEETDSRHEERLDDHETRIRSLEDVRGEARGGGKVMLWIANGGWIALGGLIVFLLKLFMQKGG